MGQSLVKNYLHIVFSTKLRVPINYPHYNLELYNYLGGICNNLESQVVKIGGYSALSGLDGFSFSLHTGLHPVLTDSALAGLKEIPVAELGQIDWILLFQPRNLS